MFKKIIILLSLLILLLAAGVDFSTHTVQAESISTIHNSNQVTDTSHAKPLTVEPDVPNLKGYSLSLTEQLNQLSLAIQENHQAIQLAEIKASEMKSEVETIEREIHFLEDSINKRTNVLKDRALAYQQSEKHITYLEVLIGATSLSDFVERVGAVAAIAEADRTLIEQQEDEQKELTKKQTALQTKLTNMAEVKREFDLKQAHLIKQQAEIKQIEEQLKQEKTKKSALLTINSVPTTGNDYIQTVINAGKKYIGNSVYAFGGGRTTKDIARGRFDCSGFVHWAFSQAGIEIGSNTSSIKNDGRQISPSEMQPGDLVFFDTYKRDGHVGIYLGDGKFIGSQSSTGVAIADMKQGYWKNAFKGRVVRI